MIKVTDKLPENIDSNPQETLADSLYLSFDMRQRGRFKATSERGVEVGVVLSERGKVLADGQILYSECGHFFRVKAEAEELIKASTDDWQCFSKACYHLGNRHVPLQIDEHVLYFKPDHVLEDMIHSLGLITESCKHAFNPESGAYSSSHHHEHA